LPLQRRGTDEFFPPAYGAGDRRALRSFLDGAGEHARRVGRDLAVWSASRRGTAAALLAVNHAAGERFFEVPDEAPRDGDAAEAALGGDEFIFDVQTHYVAQERRHTSGAEAVLQFIRAVAPERWKDLRGGVALSLAEYLRCVFLESETDVAVLTAAPGEDDRNILANPEIAGTRELVDRLGGTGRLLHHAIVHPNHPGELDAMERMCERFRPVGWKVYTLYGRRDARTGESGWRLDDEAAGRPFLERCGELGPRIVCAHKGLSGLAPTGSPADVGPAAAAFPGLDFLVYHSGYELPEGDDEEGAFAEDGGGTNRLVQSLHIAGVQPGGNVYAELGSTWFVLLRRPREAAHVLGKLLLAVGEDNVLWGTDSIWYGSPQPLIDAFRAFQIPEAYRERYGYPELTRRLKARILGLNAARVYGVDPERARAAARGDDLSWVRAALADYRERGTPRV
jgi:hypothetical protein